MKLRSKKVVEFTFLGAVEESIEFRYRVGKNRTARILGVGDHDGVAAPRHLDAISSAALNGGPPWCIC